MNKQQENKMERKIYYKEGYKAQLSREYSIQTRIYPQETITSNFIILYPTGILVIKKGYAWDFASGPTIDTENCKRGSLVHDALYQLLREGDLVEAMHSEDERSLEDEHERIRKIADDHLSEICKEDGMSGIRAELWEWAVNKFAHGSSVEEGARPELTAGVDA